MMVPQEQVERRSLSTLSSAESHDCFELELSGAWEPQGSSGTTTVDCRTRTHGCLLERNKVQSSGGLCLLWKSECQVAIRSASLHHIDGEVGGIGDPAHWRFTGFYGYPSTADRYSHGNYSVEGGAPRPIRQMLAFRQPFDCALEDLGFEGLRFTWYSARVGGIKERLDRALANLTWQGLFPASRVVHLESSRSDHLPILIYLNQHKIKTGHLHLGFFEHVDQSC
ncbi:unnamed protein product [Prunus armeniaca]|uniref:Endonuclease/exonuclease/phosphatase domain-containing protein n=1 Tax=Prunus armeniaca TaxID=36596 RepID=A0A6J5XCQ2_PRUAR|nr:unnamed protein product [Prunus armeniaca]